MKRAVIFALGAAVLIHPLSVAAAAEDPAAGLAFERGARALRAGDVEGALEPLSRAASLDPQNARTLGLYARTLVIAGREQEASEVLERLKAVDPDAAELVYLRGLAAYQAADWDGAREDLRAALAERPDHAVLHLLLGRVNQELGDLDASDRELAEALRLDPTLEPYVSYRRGLIAMEQARIDDATVLFEEVQARLPGTALARSASRHLVRLAFEQQRKWELWASFGGGYDSNVSLANGDDVLVASDEDDALAIASLGGSYQLLRSERYGLRVGQLGFANVHAHEKDFNLLISESWAEANWLITDQVAADLGYSFEYVWRDGNAFRRTHRIEPTIQVEPARDLLLRAFYRYQHRNYDDIDLGSQFDRDGRVQTTGFDIYYQLPELLPSVDGWFRAGYRYRVEDTGGNQYDAHGHEPVLTVSVTLPQQMILTLGGRLEWRRYDARSLLDRGEGRRNDRIGQFDLGIRRAINRHLSLELVYRFTKRSSNVNAYDYNRNQVLGLATYRF